MKLILVALCLLMVQPLFAKEVTPKKTYSYEKYENKTHDHEWDFTGFIGLYNPGTGFGARAAYRVLGDVLPSANDSLSVESGLTFIGVNDTLNGVSASYSIVEIPIHARWDFHIANQKMVVGPVAGLNYVTAAAINNVTVSRSGGVFIQLGGSGIYYFSENLGGQAQLLIGSYTTLMLGINYAL